MDPNGITVEDRLASLEQWKQATDRKLRISLIVNCVLALLLGFCISALARAQTPAIELSKALRDIRAMPDKNQRISTRYLSLYAIPEERRDDAVRAVLYVLNANSRSSVLHRPDRIEETLIRIDMHRYAPEKEAFLEWYGAWEKMTIVDPYWKQATEVLEGDKKIRRTVNGPWLKKGEARELSELTRSKGAIVRADFFLVQATSTAPFGVYYDFAGIPEKEADFYKIFGVDLGGKDYGLLRQAGASIIRSNVTFKPRRILRNQSVFGGVYVTRDSERVDAARDPLRFPINLNNQFENGHDATETFAPGRNGLMRWALYNAAGERQDSVPDKIAKDTSDSDGPGILMPSISCLRCHVDSGFRLFTDDFSELMSGKADLVTKDYLALERLRFFYDQSRLGRWIALDQQEHELSTQEATGGPFKAVIASLAAEYNQYAYAMVGLEDASREVGMAPDAFKDRLSGSGDPIILALVAGRSVLRDQWASSFAEAAQGAIQ